MKIKLTIERKLENPNYDKEVEAIEKYGSYGNLRNSGPTPKIPERYSTENILVVELSEGQFEAIRRAVLESF